MELPARPDSARLPSPRALRHAVLGASLALLLATLGCSDLDGDDTTATAVERALSTAARTGQPADIGTAVPGGWTRLVFACAYASPAWVDDTLGFAWPDYEETVYDGLNTWIFATDDRVVTWAVVRGYHGDPCYYYGRLPDSVVARDEARFRVEDTGERVLDGVPYRALRPRV